MVDINLAYNLTQSEMIDRLCREENITALEDIIISDIKLYENILRDNPVGKDLVTEQEDVKKIYISVKKIVEDCIKSDIKDNPELVEDSFCEWGYEPSKISWSFARREEMCLFIAHELTHHVLYMNPELRSEVKYDHKRILEVIEHDRSNFMIYVKYDHRWIWEGFARTTESRVARFLSEKEKNPYYMKFHLGDWLLPELINVYRGVLYYTRNCLGKEEVEDFVSCHSWKIMDWARYPPRFIYSLNEHQTGTAVYSIAEQGNPNLLEDILLGKLSVLRI